MIRSDSAVTQLFQDKLGRGRIAETMATMLRNPALATPLTVGILGGWGTGKTSLMRLLERHLLFAPDDGEPVEEGELPPLTLWFDAWAYARQEQSLWRALLLRITGDLGNRAAALLDEDGAAELRSKLDRLEDSLYRSLTLSQPTGFKVNMGEALPFAADIAFRFATAGLSDLAGNPASGKGPIARFVKLLQGKDIKEAAKLIERTSRETYVGEVRSLEQFKETFREALELVGVRPSLVDGGTDDGPRRRLYVFVDDLDRCLPDDAVAAVEAIKLFLDLPGCVFILGMDSEVIQSGIQARYARYFPQGELPFRAADYLDKVIQLPFRLPPLDKQQVSLFLDDFVATDQSGLIADTRTLVQIAVPNNPRALKRALNVLGLTAELDGCGIRSGTDRSTDELARRRCCLAKVVLMQICFPEAHGYVLEKGPQAIMRFQAIACGQEKATADVEDLLPPRLRELFGGESGFEDESEAAELLTLARSAALPNSGGV